MLLNRPNQLKHCFHSLFLCFLPSSHSLNPKKKNKKNLLTSLMNYRSQSRYSTILKERIARITSKFKVNWLLLK